MWKKEHDERRDKIIQDFLKLLSECCGGCSGRADGVDTLEVESACTCLRDCTLKYTYYSYYD